MILWVLNRLRTASSSNQEQRRGGKRQRKRTTGVWEFHVRSIGMGHGRGQAARWRCSLHSAVRSDAHDSVDSLCYLQFRLKTSRLTPLGETSYG